MIRVDKNYILQEILQGNLGNALKKFDALTKAKAPEKNNDAIMLNARYNRLKGSMMDGVTSGSTQDLQLNRITIALQHHLDGLDPNLFIELDEPAPVSTPVSSPSSGGGAPTPSPASKTKILFLASNPKDQESMDTDKEHRRLKQELERGSKRDNYVFLPSQFSVTRNELIRAFKQDPHIIHFSGHGETDGIILVNDDNMEDFLSAKALKRLFKPLKGITKLVIMNACHSQEQAIALSSMGMYVIGHNLAVQDEVAISFTEGFYISLGEGSDIEEAFNDGIGAALSRNDNADEEIEIEIWKDGEKLDI